MASLADKVKRYVCRSCGLKKFYHVSVKECMNCGERKLLQITGGSQQDKKRYIKYWKEKHPPKVNYEMTSSRIQDRIRSMNETFKLPSNDIPTDHGVERLRQFHMVLREECDELLEAVTDSNEVSDVALADCLADIIIYCMSEARRWGYPINKIVNVVLDSQDSKLVNGKPVMAPDGSKFIKGPNYKPPEKQIEHVLSQLLLQNRESNNG